MAKSKITVDKDTNVPQPDTKKNLKAKIPFVRIGLAACLLGFHATPVMEVGERQQITHRCPRCKEVLKVI